MDCIGRRGAMEFSNGNNIMARVRRLNCRPLRDLFLVVVTVATISIAITYHISKYLPPRQQAELKIHFNGRVDIYRSLDLPPQDNTREVHVDGNHGNMFGDRRQGLEGMDIEAWEKRMRERRKSKRGATLRHALHPELLKKLNQVDQLLVPPPGEEKVAVIGVDSTKSHHQEDIYQRSLEGAGYTTLYDQHNNTGAYYDVGHDNYHRGYKRQQWDTGWALGLCLRSSGHHEGSSSYGCPPRAISYKLFQKINVISALDSMFASAWSFCVTMTTAQYIPSVSASSPLCYLLPQQYEDFLTRADTRGPGTKWVLKPLESSVHAVHLVEPTNRRDFLKINKLSRGKSVVQEYLPDPLNLYGLPFSVTVYVLVTSWRPLRAHLHSYGTVYFRLDYQGNFRKIPGRTWSLDQWLQYVAETHTQTTADVTKRNIDSVVTQTLLMTEAVQDSQDRCSACFQLLSFDLIFNSTYYPTVLNINSRCDLSESVRADSGTKTSAIIHDIVTMVTATTSIVTDVAMALEELNIEVSQLRDGSCPSDSTAQTCLTNADIAYLLALRRESVQKGGFKLLYPSTEADKYSTLINHLDNYARLRWNRVSRAHPSKLSPAHRLRSSPQVDHGTADLHAVSVSMLRYLHNLERMEEAYDDLNIPLFSDQHLQNKDLNQGLLENIYPNTTNTEETYIRHRCSEDENTMPYVNVIYTDPPLDLSPEYNQSTTEYYATVPYHVFLVKVWALAVSCYSEARLNDKYGLSRPSNMTLGLGNNKISILVVDVRHTEPWTINTYTLYINRQQAGEGLGSVDQGQPHTVCSLVQDCTLRYLPSQPCDLEPSTYTTWQQYQKQAAVLPSCGHGDEQGEWLVPCRSCGDSSSCGWSSAVWQPRSCSHPTLPRDTVRQCLVRKQILFIGDSTNRGIMHYVMEQVNGTLTEWDKTHDIKIYTNLNQDQTSVSFAYYPQFWLPSNQRPVFDKALYDLIKQAGPLENNKNTVLVVGGVHWLATHHLKVITQALKRENLERIQVIVKGLGAGFHQPVDGLHCLSSTEQRKLVIHNAGLVDFARSLGFSVVDTFNMTMARYKDFLQGKCACHFHRVREVLPSFTQYMRATSHNTEHKLEDMPILYHVEGNINAAYSEILLNTICQQS